MAQGLPRTDKPHGLRRTAQRASKHPLILLLALEAFAIFAVAPLIDMGMLPHPLLVVTFSLILVVGMWTLDDRAVAGKILIGVGAVTLPLQVWRFLSSSEIVQVLHPLGLIAFLVLMSWVLANAVFRSDQIKMEQVLGGVVLYLNIGLTFAIIFTLIEHVAPGSFLLPPPLPERPVQPSYFTYFSFVTLTTVGYGDTVPVGAMARSLATLEAALGQLYPAIILARLVSIEVTQHDQRRSQHGEKMAQDQGRAAGDL